MEDAMTHTNRLQVVLGGLLVGVVIMRVLMSCAE
jgi:hypothetical protein